MSGVHEDLSPEDQARIAAANDRYNAAAHGMQSGVAFEHSAGSTDATPKHLRVGINSAMVNCEAVAHLLIERGLFSLADYIEEIADAMEREVQRYEERHPGVMFR